MNIDSFEIYTSIEDNEITTTIMFGNNPVYVHNNNDIIDPFEYTTLNNLDNEHIKERIADLIYDDSDDYMKYEYEFKKLYDIIKHIYTKQYELIVFNTTITSIAWHNWDAIKYLPIYRDTNKSMLKNIKNIIIEIHNKYEEGDINYYKEVAKLFSNIYNIKISAVNEFLYADYSEIIKKIKKDSLILDISFFLEYSDFFDSNDIEKLPDLKSVVKVKSPQKLLSIIPYTAVSLHPLGLETKEIMLEDFPYSEVFKKDTTTRFLKNLTKDIHKLCSDLSKADYNDLFDIAMEMELITMPEIMGLQRGVIELTKTDLCRRIKTMLQIQNEDVAKLLNDIELMTIDDVEMLEPATKKMKLY